jgi:indolepyruvate ferredoxin oxidoreductase
MRENAADTLVPSIPYGEADVLIGVDPLETLRALVSDPMLQIATPGVTSIIANTELAAEEGTTPSEFSALLEIESERRCGTPADRVEAFSKQVLQQFGNRRLLDVVLVGVAYQRGLIPVSLTAITDAAQQLERVGFGRSGEAFRFGRLLASRPVEHRGSKSPGIEPIGRRRREIVLETRLHRGVTSAVWLDQRIGRLVETIPGLLETEAGRIAFDDVQLAVASLSRRGGKPLVDEYLHRIERIYRADRGETGRELTRLAVLPLGEAMLARDLFALAVAATSLDHRRRLRRRLGVRRARGDRLERIYQVRIDLVAFDRRMRAEIPVRDWVLPFVARIGRFIPEKRRGDRESRARRLAIESGIDRAITQSGDSDAYRRWCKILRSWHDLASDGRLHETPVSVFASAGDSKAADGISPE